MKCPICTRPIEANTNITCRRCWGLIRADDRQALGTMFGRRLPLESKLAAVRKRVLAKYPELGPTAFRLAVVGVAGVSGLGMDNKSGAPRDMRNAAPIQESAQVSTGGACCDVGPAGFSVTERSAPGSEGPGVGSAKKLNSDDQMPGPAYP